MLPARIARQLSSIDWDFPEHFPGTSKNIHWYPGTFPAELPGTLIQAFSSPGQSVFDPYGGVGTTAAESIRQGRIAIMADNNPIGLLASLTLNGLLILKAIDPALSEYVLDDVEGRVGIRREVQRTLLTTSEDFFAEQVRSGLGSAITPNPVQIYLDARKRAAPAWTALAQWIERGTLKEVESFVRKFDVAGTNSFAAIVGMTMVSACLRAGSSQTQSWGHIADNVRPREFIAKPFGTLCFNWIRKLRGAIRATNVLGMLDRREKYLYLLNHDWNQRLLLKHTPRRKADLLISSPPYANAIDYTYAQRLSLHLLGYTEEEIHEQSTAEIGARRKRFSSVAATAWSESLIAALEKQVALLSDTATICLVLPHKEAGREIAAIDIKQYLVDNGWSEVFRTNRSIRQSRTRQSWTSIKRETLLIFQ